MKNKIKFYRDKVAINLLAKDIDNAINVNDTLDGHAVIGVLSKRFDSVAEGVEYVKEMSSYIPAISIGLGDGDPNQWEMAANIAAETNSSHVNQVFTTAGYTLGLLNSRGANNTLVNALISPTGQIGKVKISTGPYSSKGNVVVNVENALLMLKDSNIMAVKFYNIGGKKHIEELIKVAESCAKIGIPIIEPTGGIDRSNIYEIVKVCMDAGVDKVIPHVYSAAIDKDTGLTDLDIVKKLYDEIKRVFE